MAPSRLPGPARRGVAERFVAESQNNYEVLMFDELIADLQHKSTPFLTKTTFLHKVSDKYCVPPPVPALELVRYAAFPVLRLITDDSTLHISWMSVEFFKQMKLYDRHWHSLRKRPVPEAHVPVLQGARGPWKALRAEPGARLASHQFDRKLYDGEFFKISRDKIGEL